MSAAESSDTEDAGFDSMFQEPEGFCLPPPEEKIEVFERHAEFVEQDSPNELRVNLLGTHPLWGHYLWNAAKIFANYLDSHKDIVRGRSVLELGAAGALPSLVAAINGASRVVITDYPDLDLVGNIRKTVSMNMPEKLDDGSVMVEGYKWGYDIERIQMMSPDSSRTFDVLILCDLVFNHSEHGGLLRSVGELMKKPGQGSGCGGEAYVFFTHHRPWLAKKDMEFIERTQSELGLEVTRIVEQYTGAMFEDDPGDERVRGTVHGFRLSYPQEDFVRK